MVDPADSARHRSDPARWLQLLLQSRAHLTDVELADSEDQYTAAAESPLLRGLMSVFTFGRLTALAGFGLRPWPATTASDPAGALATYTLTRLFYLFAVSTAVAGAGGCGGGLRRVLRRLVPGRD
jgi:hypothetical protein